MNFAGEDASSDDVNFKSPFPRVTGRQNRHMLMIKLAGATARERLELLG